MNQIREERVDVIDGNNQVIAVVPKSVAHSQGLLHRIVIAEVRNRKGEFCFVRQAGDRQDPGQFVSPVGGHVSAGESVETALIRECQEEIGITPQKFRRVGETVFNREVIGRKENHLFLVYEIETDEPPVLNHESVEFKWFSGEEIKERAKKDPDIFGAAWHHVFKNLYPELYQ